MATNKLKIAFYWAASCGGCEIAVLDINEKILDVIQIADVVFWPVAMDFKYKDVENMPDKHIDVCFFNGGIRNSEQEHLAKLLRQKSKMLIAYGACAHLGGVNAIRNGQPLEEVTAYVYNSNEWTEEPPPRRPRWPRCSGCASACGPTT